MDEVHEFSRPEFFQRVKERFARKGRKLRYMKVIINTFCQFILYRVMQEEITI